jgi:hypothetical protein
MNFSFLLLRLLSASLCGPEPGDTEDRAPALRKGPDSAILDGLGVVRAPSLPVLPPLTRSHPAAATIPRHRRIC